MIFEGHIDFSKVKDPIRTEEVIYHKIKDLKFSIPYVSIPIAFTINHMGLKYTQELIDFIEKKYPEKKFFVCQHILVRNLNFHNNIVFTPHTELFDKFNFIPHYNPIYNEKINIKKISDRKYNFSFIGDYNTHFNRQKLRNIKDENKYISHTGKWFFEKPLDEQKILKNLYVDILNDTKMSLCPRGTGPSTLRFFESLSVGSIPIVFNKLKIPYEINQNIFEVDIDEFINRPIIDIDEKLEEKSKFIYEYYWDNLSNNNLHKSILNTLNNL